MFSPIPMTSLFSFYVLLSGKISIYIHNQDQGEDEELVELEDVVQHEDGKLDRSQMGNFVTSLSKQISF